jgi:AraC-like DNA-binding protein
MAVQGESQRERKGEGCGAEASSWFTVGLTVAKCSHFALFAINAIINSKDGGMEMGTRGTTKEENSNIHTTILRFSNRITITDTCSQEIRNIITKLDAEWTQRAEGYQLVIKALLMYLLALLYRHYTSKDELGADIKAFHSSYDKVRSVVEYIHEHFTEEVELDHLAKMASMNKSYFSSYFKTVMNKTVTSYVEGLRLQEACLLMATTSKTLTEIALDSGFNSISYFNRAFSKHYGIPPNRYRKNPNAVQ